MIISSFESGEIQSPDAKSRGSFRYPCQACLLGHQHRVSECNTAMHIVNRTAYLGSLIVVKLPSRGLLSGIYLASRNYRSCLGVERKHKNGQGGR
jgi:hypothetical protein